MSEQEIPLKIMFAKTAAEQKFDFKISPAPGRLMTAETVGGCLIQMSKIIKSAAIECGPGKAVALLAGIDFGESGDVTFTLPIMHLT